MTYGIKRKSSMKNYLKEKRGVSWNTFYKNYGVKEVNKKIESGKVYAGMDGKPTYLGR